MQMQKKLSLLGSETIGRMFSPDGIIYKDCKALLPSIIHGRSIAVKSSAYKWILIKGGGWNYGGPIVYLSKKDDELVFGLCPTYAGKRELDISKAIEKISDDFPKVLYYKRFADYKLPTEYDFLKTVCYSNGRLVDPCLIYTQVKCPFRVLDLAFQTNKEKRKIIRKCCKYWNIGESTFIEKFAFELGRHVGTLHKNGFINDTLEYSNVTLLAEIVDYELVTAPNVPFNNGIDGSVIPDERREKEVLYGAEVVLQLSALLFKQYSLLDCYRMFLVGYCYENGKYIESNKEIDKILKGDKYIL